MGLLAEGEPLDWYEIKPLIDKLKWMGIEQFIRLYNKVKDRQHDSLKWGEEIEYMMVRFDRENKKAQLLLKSTDVLRRLMEQDIIEEEQNNYDWKPEFANFMIEGSPSKVLSHTV